MGTYKISYIYDKTCFFETWYIVYLLMILLFLELVIL